MVAVGYSETSGNFWRSMGPYIPEDSTYVSQHVQIDTQNKKMFSIQYNYSILNSLRAHSSVVVKALCYKLKGHGFETWWGEFLNLPSLSGHIRLRGTLGL
jgi:hypothetical protein